MQGGQGADELDLEDEFDHPLALIQTNLQATQRGNVCLPQRTQQNKSSFTWTPVVEKQLAPVPRPILPSQQTQSPENRIPGPAGQAGAFPGGPHNPQAAAGDRGIPPEFLSPEWQESLRMLNITEFNDDHPILRGNTIQSAKLMRQSGVLPKLIAYVASLQHAHNGETYVKLRDPTGILSGTFTSDVLSTHPGISSGAVLFLEKVTILRTPPPHSMHHACIVPENVARVVVPKQGSRPNNLTSPGLGSNYRMHPPALPATAFNNSQPSYPSSQPLRFSQPMPVPMPPPLTQIGGASFIANKGAPQPPAAASLPNTTNGPVHSHSFAYSGPRPRLLAPTAPLSSQAPPTQSRPRTNFMHPAAPQQPQADTAKDLLAGIDDDFGF